MSRKHAQFKAARWRHRLLLPAWGLQAALLLASLGIFSYRLADSLSTPATPAAKADNPPSSNPAVEIVWEATNIALAVLCLALTAVEAVRLRAETLTPFWLLAANAVKVAGAAAILALDVVVYDERQRLREGVWAEVGLALDVALLAAMGALCVYSVVAFRRIPDVVWGDNYDSYGGHDNGYDYGGYDHGGYDFSPRLVDSAAGMGTAAPDTAAYRDQMPYGGARGVMGVPAQAPDKRGKLYDGSAHAPVHSVAAVPVSPVAESPVDDGTVARSNSVLVAVGVVPGHRVVPSEDMHRAASVSVEHGRVDGGEVAEVVDGEGHEREGLLETAGRA